MNKRFTPLALAILGVAASAHAQPGASEPAAEDMAATTPAEAPVVPASAPMPAAAAAESEVPAGILEDANSGRAWLTPTALLPPKGTWSFNSYELLLVGGSYAFTDNFQLSGTTVIPVASDQPLILFLSAKLGLQAAERLHFAVQGSTTLVTDEEESITGLLVGGVATLCMDRDCHSVLNGYLGAGFSLEGDNSSVPMVLSASLVQRISSRVKLVLEADSGLIVGEIDDIGEGILGWYGLRFTSRNIGVDLGLVRPFCADCDLDVFPLGFPWLTFSYRGI